MTTPAEMMAQAGMEAAMTALVEACVATAPMSWTTIHLIVDVRRADGNTVVLFTHGSPERISNMINQDTKQREDLADSFEQDMLKFGPPLVEERSCPKQAKGSGVGIQDSGQNQRRSGR